MYRRLLGSTWRLAEADVLYGLPTRQAFWLCLLVPPPTGFVFLHYEGLLLLLCAYSTLKPQQR